MCMHIYICNVIHIVLTHVCIKLVTMHGSQGGTHRHTHVYTCTQTHTHTCTHTYTRAHTHTHDTHMNGWIIMQLQTLVGSTKTVIVTIHSTHTIHFIPTTQVCIIPATCTHNTYDTSPSHPHPHNTVHPLHQSHSRHSYAVLMSPSTSTSHTLHFPWHHTTPHTHIISHPFSAYHRQICHAIKQLHKCTNSYIQHYTSTQLLNCKYCSTQLV